ncbi:MAG: acetate uptake transporter [Solirubrobacteraceae bacterium]
MSTTPADTGASSAGQGAGAFAPEQGVGVPLAVGSFGFAVLVLGLANAEVFTPAAVGIFVPVAMATGALGLLVGGLWEFRANNIFGGTFAVFYAGFLLTTALILRYFSPGIIDSAGDGGFGDAFGAWLLLWGVFTTLLSVGAYHINMPAFLAFVLLAIPYFLLGFANIIGPGDTADLLTQAGGWTLIIDGIVAWYLSWALAVNPLIGDRLPLWPYPYSTSEKGVPAGIAPSATA